MYEDSLKIGNRFVSSSVCFLSEMVTVTELGLPAVTEDGSTFPRDTTKVSAFASRSTFVVIIAVPDIVLPEIVMLVSDPWSPSSDVAAFTITGIFIVLDSVMER